MSLYHSIMCTYKYFPPCRPCANPSPWIINFICINMKLNLLDNRAHVRGRFRWKSRLVKVDFAFLLFWRVARIFFPHVIFENITKYQYFIISANSGAAAGGILFFLTYIPYMFLQPRYADVKFYSSIY
jgi:hypothetical protein